MSALQNHHLAAFTVVFSLCLKSVGLRLWTESLAWGMYGPEKMTKRGEGALEGAFCCKLEQKVVKPLWGRV